MKTEEDAELVRECLEGRNEAFEALVERYQKAIFNAAYRLVNDFEDAKDITQTVFMKAYQSLPTFDPSYRFYSWIFRIAINESLNHTQKRGRSEPLGDDHVATTQGPEAALAGVEVSRHVQAALMNLKADYRTVIVLRHFMGCSYQEIGVITQTPEKTVKSRLFSARQQLKDLLIRKGLLS